MTEADAITIASTFGPEETMNRFEAGVRAKGMTVFAQIDHSANAAEIGMSLRPTDLLIFGDARLGTPLMRSHQALGLELPLRALVWQDEGGAVWLSYTDLRRLLIDRALDRECKEAITDMAATLDALAMSTTSPRS